MASVEDCFAKLKKLFPQRYWVSGIETPAGLKMSLGAITKYTTKEEVKRLANYFLENGICHPFQLELIEKIKYCLKFDIWEIDDSKQYIKIKNEHILSDVDIDELVQILQQYPNIHYLECTVNDQGAESLANYLATNPNITDIALDAEYVTNLGIGPLAQSLSHNSVLKKLHIKAGRHLDNTTASLFAKVLPDNVSLQDLIIQESQIDDVGARYLLNALDVNTSLRGLYLGQNISSNMRSVIQSRIMKNKIIHKQKTKLRSMSSWLTPSHTIFHDSNNTHEDKKKAELEYESSQNVLLNMMKYMV